MYCWAGQSAMLLSVKVSQVYPLGKSFISECQISAMTNPFSRRMLPSTLKTLWGFTVEFRSLPMEMKLSVVVGLIVGYLYAYGMQKENFPELRGQTVVITGASKGIGEEIAYAYARRGARLLLSARNEEALRRVALECKRRGASQAYYVSADMGNEDDVKRLYMIVVEKFHGKLDYLVLNHARQVTPQSWTGSQTNFTLLKEMTDVNFYSYVQLASLSMGSIEKNGGRIVVISSVLGKMALPFFSPYASNKFALQGFFGSLQHELHMKGSSATVTLAALGRIDTDTQRTLTGNAGYRRHGTMPPGESVSATAEAVLKAGYYRKREFFYPLYNRLGVIASAFPILSDLIDMLIAFQFQKL